MAQNVPYQIDKARLCQGKMQMTVVNLRPQYTAAERKEVEVEIEKQLFSVFRKYG